MTALELILGDKLQAVLTHVLGPTGTAAAAPVSLQSGCPNQIPVMWRDGDAGK